MRVLLQSISLNWCEGSRNIWIESTVRVCRSVSFFVYAPRCYWSKFFKNFLSYIFIETLKAGAKFEKLFRIPFLMGNRLTRGTWVDDETVPLLVAGNDNLSRNWGIMMTGNSLQASWTILNRWYLCIFVVWKIVTLPLMIISFALLES